jgi:hypothetical protein
MAWTSPKTWATNDILTSTDLNTYVRDNLLALGTWTSYTPTWTAVTTNPTIGNGSIQGRYMLTTDWCYLWIGVKGGSTTSVGSGQYSLSLPVANVVGWESFVDAQLLDTAVARYPAYGLALSGASTMQIYTIAAGAGWGSATPMAFGTGDTAILSGKYRVV